jgi:hypothetical protein
MKAQIERYKGVQLTREGRTPELIDAVIKYQKKGKTTAEIAELLGFKSFHPLVSIVNQLKNNTPKIVVKEAKNTYQNYHGSGKEVARDLIADAIMDTKRQSSNVLTLPADEWIMEKNIIYKKHGYKFTAVERDKDTYKQMIRNLALDDNLLNSVICTVNKTIGEVVANDKEDTYSSAILDYCGFIDSFYNEINDMLKRNLVKKGGYVAITLAENDRVIDNPLQASSRTNTYIQNCCVEGEEVNGAKVTNDLVNILVYNNVGYKIVKKYSYKDTKTKMLLFIIKRNEE